MADTIGASPIVSQRFSFIGWSFWDWIKGNKATIKEGIKVGIPILASTLIASQLWQNFVITIVGKFVLDSVDYWLSDANGNLISIQN